ncbi:gliding motility-associated-like protein [Balneicella halophila]|uniref:Gliding motility-associated-like protein n=1 Tax=Balneicella halophila TaxID=1537566 RepID=A0A7L4UR75_BALHA|nr:gliding motility-associated C-terminal domain-containing protein [Balneicella halophila]PVX52275.1 gliding motility-associated-like protein [Balneicella halophila]
MVLPLLFAWHLAQAQIRVSSGERVELSVESIPNHTYSWELYDKVDGINFALTDSNVPSNKAQFVSGNTGSSVLVEFLQPGIYFYKVTVRSSCTNNIKIGKVIVSEANIPPPPRVILSYNCEAGTATLRAEDYVGDLLWSTGETTESITVTNSGIYTVTQTVNNQISSERAVKVEHIKVDMPSSVKAIPPKIEKGGTSALTAEGCQNGMLHWYADEALTQELTDTEVSPDETTTYYVVCENEIGCQSAAIPVIVTVLQFDPVKCKELYKNITIEQLVTPNADGYNDTWELNDLLEYCQECGKTALVRLYNRWGAKVYEKDGYMLDNERFDGYSENDLDFRNSKRLPDGTYFYIIIVEGEKELNGFINIVTPAEDN